MQEKLRENKFLIQCMKQTTMKNIMKLCDLRVALEMKGFSEV